LYALANSYVFKSTDGGNSWNTVLEYYESFGEMNVADNKGFEDVVFDVNNPDRIFVSGTYILRTDNGDKPGRILQMT